MLVCTFVWETFPFHILTQKSLNGSFVLTYDNELKKQTVLIKFDLIIIAVCFQKLIFLAVVINIVTGILCIHCLVIIFACLVFGVGAH